ncbi:Calponin-1 [Cricetulus griseus]|uniref:Calponin-1 n=1 Tax=Cricetulus griseus TaxID=10029 RepID=G3H687_CRIGR|nr:Calponin-1 [Cricetulus griseus]
MAKTKGNKVNVRVKYAEKQEQRFEPEKLREGRNIIGLQVWTLGHTGCSGLRGRQPKSWWLWGSEYLYGLVGARLVFSVY